MATLVSIQVGLPRRWGDPDASDPMDRAWESAIAKEPVQGPIRLGSTGLAGDGQADRKNHGGPDKAVLAYAAAHYPLWRAELALPDLPHGAFGENFTIDGQTEESVCIGDVYAIGDVRVQVSQPRQPCWKIARRWRIKDLTARVVETGRIGWYLRVLAEGYVEAGMPVTLLERPFPQWTVARAMAVVQNRRQDREAALELASCPVLSQEWRDKLLVVAEDG
ncbi:MAG: MOSC domain-containing protein [Chloroflexi bacterium]|nr:MOSC domain-containing protein [Chloroflexota bacterium]